jgi:L-alanine-DL-glutamate epimerase-like enolase superfamily enzyme
VGTQTQTTAGLQQELTAIAPQLSPFHPLERQRLEPLLATLSSAARAAIDVALHDWLGKQAGLPLWQLWGLDCDRIPPTSVTIGLNTPEKALERLHQWLAQIPDLKSVKIKLGSPEGIAADQALMTHLLPAIPSGTKVSVDANGGWQVADAITLTTWLAERGVTSVEQPLPVSLDHELPALAARSPLPIFVDESCFTTQDIPHLAKAVQGINIKLMKAGGLTEALRMLHLARALGLQVMVGCYSDSCLSNTALAQLSPLVDHIDLDSHLNLRDDPFHGATLRHGCLIPNSHPGLGVYRNDLPLG